MMPCVSKIEVGDIVRVPRGLLGEVTKKTIRHVDGLPVTRSLVLHPNGSGGWVIDNALQFVRSGLPTDTTYRYWFMCIACGAEWSGHLLNELAPVCPGCSSDEVVAEGSEVD